MARFKRAVDLTEREVIKRPDQSWIHRIRQMERISETIRCSRTGDELLEDDCQAGGKWEQHAEDEYRRFLKGDGPAEVIRPGHALQIEVAKYFRAQLDEDYPSVFDDEESSDSENEATSTSVPDGGNDHMNDKGGSSDSFNLSEDSGAEGNDCSGFSDGSVDGQTQPNQFAAPEDASKAQPSAPQTNGEICQDASSSTSSSEAGAVADDLDDEKEQLAAVFADFPTCIDKTKHIVDMEDEQYGLLAMAQDPAWLYVGNEKLTTRVRDWIADFTCEYAACCPANLCTQSLTTNDH